MLHISHYHFFKIFLFSASSFISRFLAFSLSPFFPLLSSSYGYSLFIFHITRLCLIIFTLFVYLSTITMHYTFSHHPSLHFCIHLIFVFTYQHYSVFIIYIILLYILYYSLHYCLHLIFIYIHLMIHFPLAKNYVIQRCSCPSVPSLYFYSFFTSPVFRYLCLHLIDVSFHH